MSCQEKSSGWDSPKIWGDLQPIAAVDIMLMKAALKSVCHSQWQQIWISLGAAIKNAVAEGQVAKRTQIPDAGGDLLGRRR